MSRSAALVLSLAMIAVGTTAPARSMMGDRWPLVGSDRENLCELELRSNPEAIQIKARGFIPGETLHLVFRNGGMKPLKITRFATEDGQFRDYYAPLKNNYGAQRFGAPALSAEIRGLVEIEIAAARCKVSATSPWSAQRPTIP